MPILRGPFPIADRALDLLEVRILIVGPVVQAPEPVGQPLNRISFELTSALFEVIWLLLLLEGVGGFGEAQYP